MYGHLPFVKYSFQVYPYDGKNGTRIMNVHCVSPLLPYFPHNTLINIGVPFWSGSPKSSYMSVLKHLNFVETDLWDAERFVTNTMKNKTYVGIHLRGLDGECEIRNRNKAVCSMSWEYISEIIKSHGYDPDTVPIFLATDKQNINATQRLLAQSNVHVWNETEGGEHYNRFMIDMCLLSHSSLFIGNGGSSFSFHVSLWREIHNYSENTSIFGSNHAWDYGD